jgi:cytosine/adenosine deaminase-related metal-dependent hydrolase
MRKSLEKLGAWDESGLAKDLASIALMVGPARHVVFIHGNYLTELQVQSSQSRIQNLVYCPRTHVYFGHGPHPFRRLQAAGINVALGTDSLASNPDLSVLEEMRFLARHCPDLPGEAILEMGTVAGARALGWEQETGTLEPGKSADYVTIPCKLVSATKALREVWESAAPPEDVYISGQAVVQKRRPTGQDPWV